MKLLVLLCIDKSREAGNTQRIREMYDALEQVVYSCLR